MKKIMHFGSSNDTEAVKKQYSTSKGLDIRIGFHNKYSTNKQGYSNWIISNYNIKKGMKVLELGCGTGGLWEGHEDIISRCSRLVLTDFSEGMLETAKNNLGERNNIEYIQADIQYLPFEENSFDVVIANSMLYHVPDIDRGIREVRRVLKQGGTFYCATLGENNFPELLAEWFELEGEEFKPNHNFTMQNGGAVLGKSFADVKTAFYEDSLHVTDVEDLVEYLRSLASFKVILDLPVEKIREILKEHIEDEAVDLPKEYGMFICQ